MLQRKSVPSISRAPLGIPILEWSRVLLHVDLLVEPVHLLLFRLHFVGAPTSHKCQSFVRGASIAATPPRGLRQVRGVLDEGWPSSRPKVAGALTSPADMQQSPIGCNPGPSRCPFHHGLQNLHNQDVFVGGHEVPPPNASSSS